MDHSLSPLSTLKLCITPAFAPPRSAVQSLTANRFFRPLTVVAGAGASHCEFSSLNSPLDPRTRPGKDLCTVLQNHPRLFHLSVAQELKKLADDRELALSRASLSAASHEACLHRPQEVSAAEGAGLPSSGLSAHQALTQAAGIKLDGTGQLKNILITGASGGVGHYVVQLAKLGNTHVTATCGACNIDIVRSLGADEVLDYKTPDGTALKSSSDWKYDFVIHCASAGIPWSTFEPNLSANGKVIDLTCALQRPTFSKKQLVPMIIYLKRENLEYLVELMKEGKLKTVIDSKHHLSKAAWARRTDGYANGKIIVEI